MSLELLAVIITTMAPIAELRGGIPLGIALGLEPFLVIITAFIFNCLVFFPVYFALSILYGRFFVRFSWCRRLIERIQKRGKPYIERYGVLGLLFFVGIPLPMTGAWTGTGIAWVLGLDWKKSFLTICLGVLMATVIVSLLTLGVLNGMSLLMG